jgi:hypothetical protein
MFNNMSDDDANSTQLEGKKLKKKGVVIDGQYLEITENSPALMEEVELDEGQEYFIEREYAGIENGEEREERMEKERVAALKINQQKQEQQQQQQVLQNSTEQVNKIERGMMLSKNKGRPVDETQFRREGPAAIIERNDAIDKASSSQKNDLPAAHFLVGDNVDKLDFKDSPPTKQDVQKYDLKNSVPAQKLPDVRDKGEERGI